MAESADFTVNMLVIGAALDIVAGRLEGVIPDDPMPIGRICKDVLADKATAAVRGREVDHFPYLSPAEWRLVSWALRAARHASVIPAMQGNERELLK